MTEAKIHALVDRGLLRPKTEVEWRAAAGEEFPSEDVKEQASWLPSLSAASTSQREPFFAACCTTTGWSWYTSFLTPPL
jgi:hypothetical protein